MLASGSTSRMWRISLPITSTSAHLIFETPDASAPLEIGILTKVKAFPLLILEELLRSSAVTLLAVWRIPS